MAHPSKKLAVNVKVWIEDGDGHMVFGIGRMRILEAVDRYRAACQPQAAP